MCPEILQLIIAELTRQIDGRIMVDAAAYFNAKPRERQELRALDAALPEISVIDQRHGRYPPYDNGMGPRRRGPRRRGRRGPVVEYFSDDESDEELVVVRMKPETDSSMSIPSTVVTVSGVTNQNSSSFD